MNSNIFYNGTDYIKIVVDKNFINFIKSKENIFKSKKYFYWIGVDEWKSDFISKRPGNFQEHMMAKKWFNEKMLNFINTTLKCK